MNILVTGNLGYIGTVLVPLLQAQGHQVIGLDGGYFDECQLSPVSHDFKQITKDIRDVVKSDLDNIEAVIHLAGLSNDPLGELSPGITEEINLGGTMKLAELAKEVGVKRFIYSSSQSMYGVADTDDELDEDLSNKNPVTAYAKTKWDAELQLNQLQSDSFLVCSFRPSTVFGVSPRLRCDIVFNNLVACAYTTNKIEIKSDGTPWRPVVHIQDVCAAFLSGLSAPKELLAARAFNVGIPDGNYTVRQLAEAAQRAVPGSTLIFTGEHGNDSRTYRVSFKRILTELKDYYSPSWNLDRGATELVNYFKKINFTEKDFRGWKTTRLMQLNRLVEKKELDSTMRRGPKL
ncbi:NAD(P)-dependent oxidoreductase [Candidatus Thioglobus sp.]|nr:NAD(P)-dependent oxidoreductase [Candidatus Thioglobus sp.]